MRAPPRAMDHGLQRLLTDVAARVAPLPVATGSLKLGLSVVSKWLMVGFIAGLGGAGAASQIFAPNSSSSPALTLNAPPYAPTSSETNRNTRAPRSNSIRISVSTSVIARLMVLPFAKGMAQKAQWCMHPVDTRITVIPVPASSRGVRTS